MRRHSGGARAVLNEAYPRAGSTAMPTGLPAPLGEPLFVIRVFRYCTSPLNFRTWPSTNTNRCGYCAEQLCCDTAPSLLLPCYKYHLNRLCSRIGVVQVLCYPVQRQTNRRAQDGCRCKLGPIGTIRLHPVDLTLDGGKTKSIL